MLVYVESYVAGTWRLFPVSRRVRRRMRKATGECCLLYQVDYEYQELARMLGWNGKVGSERCSHSASFHEGVCHDCRKVTTMDLINAANAYLTSIEDRVKRVDCDELFEG